MRRKRSEAPDGLSQGLIKNGQNLSFSASQTVSDLEAPADSADSPRSGVAQITSPADPEEEKRQKTAPFNSTWQNFKHLQRFLKRIVTGDFPS